MTSSTTRSTSGSSAMRRPVSPSCASTTSWPSLRRLRRSPNAIARSSSTTTMRAMRSALLFSRGGPGGDASRPLVEAPDLQTVAEGKASFNHRKDNSERAAFAELRVDLDPAAVRLDDLLADGEAQPGAFGLAGEQVVAAVEALEDAFAVLEAHAGAVVLHLDGDALFRAARAQEDALHLAGVLDRVVQEVEHHLRHRFAVDVDGREAGLDHRVVGGVELLRAVGDGDLFEQGRDLHGFLPQHALAALQARPGEQLLHQLGETLRLRREQFHALAHLLGGGGAAVAQRLGEEAHAGQGRAQLVRDVGHEVRLQPRELVGAAHLPDGEAEADADAEVEENEQPDVERAVAEGERGGGVVAGEL